MTYARFNLGLISLIMSVVFYRLSQTASDPDLWGHIKFGQDIWQAGRVIQGDPYSYLTGHQRWINHEWLAEVIFYIVFARLGVPGLVALKTSVALFITGLVYWHLCRQGLNPMRAGMVLLIVTLLLIPGLAVIRPHLFTYLLFLLVMFFMHAAEHGRMRWLWGMPPLMALWVNLHGGFLAGVGIFLLWSVLYVARLWWTRRPTKRLWLDIATVGGALACTLLAMLLNPYGLRLLIFLFRLQTVVRPEISEWQPLLLMSRAGAVYAAGLAVLGAGWLWSGRARPMTLVALSIAMAFLPLTAYRHTMLFGIAFPMLAGEHIADAWNRWSPPPTPRFKTGLAVLTLAGALVLSSLALRHFRCIRIESTAEDTYPARAVGLLQRSGVEGNLAVDFNWGEYAIWHLAPRIKVSLDGRRETVYSEAIYQENLRFFSGIGDWGALLRRHETHMALIQRGQAVYNLMKLTPGWVLVYEDPLCGLFARADGPFVRRIQATPLPTLPYNGVGLCFP